MWCKCSTLALRILLILWLPQQKRPIKHRGSLKESVAVSFAEIFELFVCYGVEKIFRISMYNTVVAYIVGNPVGSFAYTYFRPEPFSVTLVKPLTDTFGKKIKQFDNEHSGANNKCDKDNTQYLFHGMFSLVFSVFQFTTMTVGLQTQSKQPMLSPFSFPAFSFCIFARQV